MLIYSIIGFSKLYARDLFYIILAYEKILFNQIYSYFLTIDVYIIFY